MALAFGKRYSQLHAHPRERSPARRNLAKATPAKRSLARRSPANRANSIRERRDFEEEAEDEEEAEGGS
eukprot:6970354-Pyramimonas_sp.AAC.1